MLTVNYSAHKAPETWIDAKPKVSGEIPVSEPATLLMARNATESRYYFAAPVSQFRAVCRQCKNRNGTVQGHAYDHGPRSVQFELRNRSIPPALEIQMN